MPIKFDLFENPEREGVEVPEFHAKVITKGLETTRTLVRVSRKNVLSRHLTLRLCLQRWVMKCLKPLVMVTLFTCTE